MITRLEQSLADASTDTTSLSSNFIACIKGWHSNIFCTSIFILGQDESQGLITEIADGQKSSLLCMNKGQPQILVKPQSELSVIHRIRIL